MIIGEIKRYLRDNNSIRVSRSVRDLAYKALSVKEELSKKLGREVSVDEICKALGERGIEVSAEDVVASLEAITEPVSLYEPIYNDGSDGDSVYVMDRIGDDRNTDESWLEDIALEQALGKLSDREKTIINLRFFAGKTQMEIAEEIGISQAQVSRLEKGALERIKKQF